MAIKNGSPVPETERRMRKAANDLLHEVGRTYHDGLPIGRIDAILNACGFDETSPAIYCGRDGQMHEQVGPKTWITMAWHKMETGTYEIVSYLS
jgi:hypothetical protein